LRLQKRAAKIGCATKSAGLPAKNKRDAKTAEPGIAKPQKHRSEDRPLQKKQERKQPQLAQVRAERTSAAADAMSQGWNQPGNILSQGL